MLLALRLDPGSLRRWHRDLAVRLGRRPETSVVVCWAEPATPAPPTCVETLFGLERLLHRIDPGRSGALAPAAVADLVREGGERPDLVIDLAGGAPVGPGPTWSVCVDDAPWSDRALLSALLGGRLPVLSVVDRDTGRVRARGLPGTEAPHVVVSSFEDVLARAETLIVAALDRAIEIPSPASLATSDLRCVAVARFAGKAIARAALHRIYRLLYRTPHWRVGWRFVDGSDLVDLGAHPSGGWRTLPDDGLRFYADPFPIVVDGRHWVFVEDLAHRSGKGVISAVPFDESGPVGRPCTVLDTHSHLSYPMVFEDDGAIWMIPESSQAGTVDLFRATRFPEGWVHEARLLDGIEASDATPFRHRGRWWMTATVRDGGSYSDALHLWSADHLRGPWRPHPANPVLVDAGAARPAGRVVDRDGRLIRPVQDCRGGYGSALGLAEVMRLDETGFEQRVVGTIGPGPLWPGRRLHTLNRAGRLECIDGSALAPRWRRAAASTSRLAQPGSPAA